MWGVRDVMLECSGNRSVNSVGDMSANVTATVVSSSSILSRLRVGRLVTVRDPGSNHCVVTVVMGVCHGTASVALGSSRSRRSASSTFGRIELIFINRFVSGTKRRDGIFEEGIDTIPSVDTLYCGVRKAHLASLVRAVSGGLTASVDPLTVKGCAVSRDSVTCVSKSGLFRQRTTVINSAKDNGSFYITYVIRRVTGLGRSGTVLFSVRKRCSSASFGVSNVGRCGVTAPKSLTASRGLGGGVLVMPC